MPKHRSTYARVFALLVIQVLVVLIAVAVVSAASEEPAQLSDASARAVGDPSLFPDAFLAAESAPSAPLQPAADTTLEVSIVSAPWALLDHNNPTTDGPHVLVVEAAVTNTGATTATLPVISLDYNEDPTNNWVLLAGEAPVRKVTELGPDETYHAYWFATYSTTISETHVYTVTADAENADPVSTSQNSFRPTADTVQTRRALEGGSTRLQETTSDIIIGVVFTTTVRWDLGTNFFEVLLSPVGNVDFDPSSYRLVGTQVTFFNETVPLQTTPDRLYFDTVPVNTTHALGEFYFAALRPRATRICPYTSPLFSSDFKYDNAFCQPDLPIEGTNTLTMTKAVNAAEVQQGQMLTYTIAYTNTGSRPLRYVWIWDDVDPAIGSVIIPSLEPPGDPGETTAQRAAWNVGDVAPTGQPGSTGMFTFTIMVNGGGQDLADQTPIVNDAFFGIDPVELPANSALTSTVTSTVQAPTITVAKTDGLSLVKAGEPLTYTLRMTNSGHITASGVVITDLLPTGVSPSGGSSPPWNPDPIPPHGGFEVIAVPVTVNATVPDGSILTNVMTATYQNEAGWTYDPETATDETTVSAPFWILTKSDDPDSVLAGSTLTYTVSYHHNGTSTAQDISITDTLPADVTYEGMVSQPPGWDPPLYDSGPPATLTWYTPSLTAGANGAMVFTVTVDSGASGLITNQAVVTSTDPATYTMTSEDTTVNTTSDLSINKSDDPDPVADGGTLTYTLTYTNSGPSDAQNVYITDTLDSKTALGGVVSQPSGWVALPPDPSAPNTLVWQADAVSAEASDSIVFTVIVDAGTIGAVVNNATITSDTPDDDLSNNDVQERTAVGDPFLATIYGYTFHDANCNGKWDSGEAAIAGVPINLDGPTSDSFETDAEGLYFFITDQSGVYRVLETDPDGFFSTTPNEVHLAVSLGDSYRVDFGDAQGTECAAIYGTVFEDADSNAIWDVTELGIQDVTITLTDAVTTTTNIYGSYTFSTTVAGLYTVVETDPEGYMSTTPNEVEVDVLLGNGYQVDFGDVNICTCPGDEYEEDDVLELAAELPVGVTQTHNFCDDATDWTYFTAQAGFVYTITTSSWGQRADTYLSLFDTDGQTLLASSDDFEGTDDYSSHVIWQTPLGAGGVYYVRTTNRSGLIGCDTGYDIGITQKEGYFILLPLVMRTYTAPDLVEQPLIVTESEPDLDLLEEEAPEELENEFTPTGIITHSCPDAYEVDDTWELAKPIGDGDLQVHSFDSDPVHYAADKDFVWFDIQDRRTITFTVPVITGTQTMLELYNPDGTPMEVKTTASQLVWTAPKIGRYFLSVSPDGLASYGCADVAGYKLKAEYEPRWYRYLPTIMRWTGAP